MSHTLSCIRGIRCRSHIFYLHDIKISNESCISYLNVLHTKLIQGINTAPLSKKAVCAFQITSNYFFLPGKNYRDTIVYGVCIFIGKSDVIKCHQLLSKVTSTCINRRSLFEQLATDTYNHGKKLLGTPVFNVQCSYV